MDNPTSAAPFGDGQQQHSGPARSTEPPPLFALSQIIGDVVAEAEAAHLARTTGQPRGPLTGLKRLDGKLGGALPVGLTMLLGNTGTGKTAFALQAAARCQCAALFVSCEMSPPELLRRLIANTTGDFLQRFKSGEMLPDEVRRKAQQTAEAAPRLCILDATRVPALPAHIEDVAEVVKGDARHLLIVVDSLQSWVEGMASGMKEYEALNLGLAALRRLSHQLSCPILVVSERNRASMEGGGVNAGAGTRRIEYGAECILDLERKKEAQEDGAGEVEVRAKLCKNRHGAAGETVPLLFHGALQRFKEVER